jgi:polyhydroxyalkanoate synthesis regulator phasin
MPKAEVVGSEPRRRARRRPTELPNTVEGQIAEICRDLAVQAKRMRQLKEQADELRQTIQQWVASPSRTRTANQLVVEDDAEQ